MDYKNGKIYVIRNHINDKVYVGSTTQSLAKRFSKHRGDTTKQSVERKKARLLHKTMGELGVDNFYIELIENYPCESKEQLRAREGYFIREFNSCISGYNCNVAGRSKTEWYKDNKQFVKNKNNLYRENNKEKITEMKKKYRENNKEKIRESEGIIVECECGCSVTKHHISRHKKTKKHIEKVSLIVI